jgi:Uma2 family endonuclease
MAGASGACYIAGMNIALQRLMTVPDYLAWAVSQPERRRTELINGQVVAMAPERMEHVEIKFAAVLALKQAIARAGVACHALADGMTVPIDDYTAYEPDGLVYSGERLARRTLIVPNPVIIIEVLSPSTTHIDKSGKLIGYFTLPSVAHYLIIDPDARTVTHHQRSADGSVSAQTISAGAIALDPPGLMLDAADLFG